MSFLPFNCVDHAEMNCDGKDLKVIMVCIECGSASVVRDSWSKWDVASQQWVLGGLHDSEHCENCEHPTETEIIGI